MSLAVKKSFPTSQGKCHFYITMINALMLFRELITDCEQYETCIWADSGVLNVERCTYCCHSRLKGKFHKSAFSFF